VPPVLTLPFPLCARLRALHRVCEGTSGTAPVARRPWPSMRELEVFHSTPEGFCIQWGLCSWSGAPCADPLPPARSQADLYVILPIMHAVHAYQDNGTHATPSSPRPVPSPSALVVTLTWVESRVTCMACTGSCAASSPVSSVVDRSRGGAHPGTDERPFLGVPRPSTNRRTTPSANGSPCQRTAAGCGRRRSCRIVACCTPRASWTLMY
jgi:hypothetical protein